MSWRDRYQRRFGWIPRPVRQVIVFVIGGTILLIGAVMVIAPGPALLVIPVGLGILALEFAWAARWLLQIRRAAKNVQQRVVNGFNATEHSSWPARWLTSAKTTCVACWCRLRGSSSPPGEAPGVAAPQSRGSNHAAVGGAAARKAAQS